MIRTLTPLQSPYIKVEAQVIANSVQNGKNMLPQNRMNNYYVAPSAKKIATYIVNQLFGSEITTQTEGLDIGWLMPSLKKALELGVYQKEAFIYIHKYNNKIYLECLRPTDLVDVVQNWDIVSQATIVQEYPYDKDCYLLKRIVTILNGQSKVEFKAFKEKNGKEEEVSINEFNMIFGTDYLPSYLLNYEVLINIDLGEDFFENSRHLINQEVKILNIFSEEIEKTRTKIVTSQHYSTGDVTTQWKPTSTQFIDNTLQVNLIRDYFTMLPGDKDHQFFEYLQGDIRYQEYIESFKFYDYQIIQMAGLSPSTFGYEKDAYQNTATVDVSKNASEMTIEALKIQTRPQISKLLENISKAQISLKITDNSLPIETANDWDYGPNEAFDDMKKIAVLKQVQSVSTVPTRQKMAILAPIIKKLIDTDVDEKDIDELVAELDKDNKMKIEFGEI